MEEEEEVESQCKKKKKKTGEYDERLETAMQLKFNAINTPNAETTSNSAWLELGGYKPEEITQQLKSTFKRVYSRRKQRIPEQHPIPEIEQHWNHHWVRKIYLTEKMEHEFLPKWLSFVKERQENDSTYFEYIGKTCIKQKKLERTGNRRTKGYKIIEDLYDNCIEFFTSRGTYEEIQADPEKTIIHALFTDYDENNKTFQQPHTDYAYMPTKSKSTKPPNYSWTAHMPITEEGSWITLWFGTGQGYTVEIQMGEVLLLRSDVVHGGGIPIIQQNMRDMKFHRLHFYLVTNDQPAHPGSINITHYDGVTKMKKMYVHPSRTLNGKDENE
jgi:hypothetical protein